jgi:hypothetical protein
MKALAPSFRWAPSRLLLALAALTWSSAALALPSYPKDVDTALGKPGIVEGKMAPPMGCQLCHTSTSGGTTTVTLFASYLIAQYEFPSAPVMEDALVAGSLAKLETAEPKLWADMQAGIDPNVDPVLAEQAPHRVEYGCSTGPARGGCSFAWAAALLALATVGRRTRRRS